MSAIETKDGNVRTVLVLSNNRLLSVERFRASLQVFGEDAEFVFGSFDEPGYNSVSVLRVDVVDGRYPTSSVSKVAFLNNVSTAKENSINI